MQKFTPAQWLLIDLANHYGKDKDLFDDRLGFGRELLDDIKHSVDLADLKTNMIAWTNEADEPEMFMAAALAIYDVLNGRPTGHVVGLDACNSGAQLQSLLMRCVTGMKNTGCINTGVRPDLYNLVKEALKLNIARKTVKNACVPHLYGSVAAPKNILGVDVYPYFLKACEKVMPGAEIAKNMLADNSWDSKALFHEWDMIDGALIHVKVIGSKLTKGKFQNASFTYVHSVNQAKERGDQGTKSLSANVVHSYDAYILRELDRRCYYNIDKVTTAIEAIDHHFVYGSNVSNPKLKRLELLSTRYNQVSVVALEHINKHELSSINPDYLNKVKAKLLNMLKYGSFHTKNIHDEFGCNPNHVNHMKQVYNDLLAETYESSWLVDTIQDLSGTSLHALVGAADPKITEQIRNNDYALC